MMYDYKMNIKQDIYNLIKNEYPKTFKMLKDKQPLNWDTRDCILDRCWLDDDVTGNGSGSYTFNSYRALMFLFGNEDLIYAVRNEYGIDEDQAYNWEYLDVSIRCYLLADCFDELQTEFYDDDVDRYEEYEDEDIPWES